MSSSGDGLNMDSDDGPTRAKIPRIIKQVIRVGTRKSQLAMIQTNFVISELMRIYGTETYEFEVVGMTTTGDHILDKPLADIGAKALFTKELEDALLTGEIDMIVHSLKDLPTTLPDGCCIGAILKRENPCDALVLKSGLKLQNAFDAITGDNLPSDKQRLVIGTSSLRRVSQLRHYNPTIEVIDIRGNLNTRLDKLDKGQSPSYDALVLACAGLIRGGFSNRISKSLGEDEQHKWYHAVGQGALAIECRLGDESILGVLQPLLHYDTIYEVLAERSLMYTLEGGCSVPIGVRCSWVNGNELTLHGAVFSLDGKQHVNHSGSIVLAEDMKGEDVEANGVPKNINLTGFSVPKCPLLTKRYQACFFLGAKLAKLLDALGASNILSEIKSNRGDSSNVQAGLSALENSTEELK